MKNKFMRSVTAMVVAVTMLISSQGVVTSFADGGDHSDMSESSSVQMNEVDNNGTDQSTENGTGEDAAVKDVVEMINALPAAETITEETDLVSLKDQVNAARAAYNALSDDQKAAFNADVLGKLTALEVKISELESNDQETKPSDVVQAVVDAINALPAAETITEETDLVSLKDQVNAAHAAYDALSDDQKAAFDTAVLDKLTALEAKISELESGKQETESSEAVQNVIEKIDAAVKQIDHTTETISATDGTTVTKTHITMLKDLDPANNAKLKALIDKEAAHEQDENQPALTDEEAAKLSDARKAFEDAKAKYLSKGFSNAPQAARQAYDALAEADKTQVTNYSLLTDMEANIAYISTLPENEYVAEVNGIKYSSLNEAVKEAAEGSTITLLKDCELTEGFNKTLTFTGHHKITIPKQLKSNGENWMCFGLGDTSRVLTFDGVEVEWIADSSVPWLMLQLNGTLSITNGAKLTFKFDSLSSGTRNALYMHPGAKLYVTNGSTFEILGENTSTMERPGQGIQLEKAGTASINVTGNSKFLIDGTNRGYVNSPSINVEDSTFTVQNCTSNASNGGNFTAINSTVTYQNNKGHGLSAGNVILENSTLTSHHNGLYGVFVSGAFNVDGTSKLTITENSYDGDYAGLNLAFNQSIALVKSGAEITINNNFCSGLSNWRTSVFEEGVKLTITGNSNYQTDESYGGGVFNYKANAHLTLPSDAVIYNNHAKAGGDDIYNTGEITFSRVGTDWILDDCNHKITGWYDDSDNSRWEAHEKPYHINEFVKFERNGMTTVKGLLSLKAAHGVDPINPGDPGTTEWEHSKSKTATNLDKNYQSQVTLSLPSAQEQLVTDVVFVLDKSTSATVEKQMLDMLGSLKDQVTETGAKVKVGVIIFNKEAHSVLELTELNSDNMGKIQEAIGTTISSGTNTHAGLLAGKAMLDADTSVDANRKYMILVSDGMTYMFDEPAQAINSIQATNGENEVMAGTDCWGIRHYLEGKDSFIPEDWTSYLQDVGSKLTEIEQYIQPYDNMDKTNYISKGNTELPTTVDVALYKTQEVFKQMQNNGYHCYSVLAQTNITNYPWGPAFMNYLAGGKEVSFNDIQNDIYYLLDAGSQVVDVIGEGVDNAGNEYNFDFVDKIENIDVKVGGEIISKERIADPQFSDPYITTAYGFGDGSDNNHEEATQYPNYDFVVKYYANGRDGKSDECFVWEMNTAVSNFAPVQLTYTVQLTNPQTTDGTYGQYDEDGSEKYTSLYTNKEAILYPVDTNHNSGVAEYFQKPTVSYTISNGKPVDPPVDPEDPTPRPGGGGDEDDDTPTIINETPVPTTTIDDEDVPLTNLPEDTVTIDDEEVPLKDIPNTGDMIPVPAMVAAVISIGGIALLMKKHK